MVSNLYIPNFPLPDGIEHADQYLRMLTMQGMKHHYPNDRDGKVRERFLTPNGYPHIDIDGIAKYFKTTTYTNCDGVELPMIQAKISDVENAGYLRFNFLRLDYLTVIRDTLNLIKSRCGINIDPLKNATL